jgi:hypothetical protein
VNIVPQATRETTMYIRITERERERSSMNKTKPKTPSPHIAIAVRITGSGTVLVGKFSANPDFTPKHYVSVHHPNTEHVTFQA